jgi:hypothetical protein
MPRFCIGDVGSQLGRAVQVDPGFDCAWLWFQRLQLRYGEFLSNFAFNFNLRRCSEGRGLYWVPPWRWRRAWAARAVAWCRG